MRFDEHNHDEMNIKRMSGFREEIIYNGLTKNRTIHIFEDISDDTELIFNNAINKMCKPDKNGNKNPITVKISTYGGDSFACFSICSAIERAVEDGYPVITEGYGKIMSAGVPILASGSKRRCQKNSRFLIHDVSMFVFGGINSEQMRRTVSEMEDISKVYGELIVSKSKITHKKLDEYIKKDAEWSFFGEEAKRLGLVDELI